MLMVSVSVKWGWQQESVIGTLPRTVLLSNYFPHECPMECVIELEDINQLIKR